MASSEKSLPPPPPPEAPHHSRLVAADLALRLLLFAAAVVAVVVMVTSKQTEMVRLPVSPFPLLPRAAKFNHSPALIYLVAALSVAGLYSIITGLVSFLALSKPGASAKILAHFVILDVLMLGIVASATGAAGGVAYIGLEGNSHVGWNKICSVYDTFCGHVGGSIVASLIASVVLALLVILSAYSLSKKIPK